MLSTRRGSNPQPPDHQSDAHPTEPLRPALSDETVTDSILSDVTVKDSNLPAETVTVSKLSDEIVTDSKLSD